MSEKKIVETVNRAVTIVIDAPEEKSRPGAKKKTPAKKTKQAATD